MIHEGQCNIVIPAGVGVNIMGIGAEPPIPTDAEIDEVFPEWRSKGRIFIGRVAIEENRDSLDTVTPQDMFRWGMKYCICEAKKVVGI